MFFPEHQHMVQPLLPLHTRPFRNMLKYSELFLDSTYFVSILSLLLSHLPTQPKWHTPFPHILALNQTHTQCYTCLHTYVHPNNHMHTATPTCIHMCTKLTTCTLPHPLAHIHAPNWPHTHCHTHLHTYMHLIDHTHTATPTCTHTCT